MKKILILLTTLLLAISLTACGSEEEHVEGTLEEIMTKLYEGIPEDQLPGMLQNTVVNADNVEWFLGSSDIEYAEALASESMIGSIAHSVVLVRANDVNDVENLKETIKANIDTRKWICVGIDASELVVDSIGDLIVVIIDDLGNSQTIHQNFQTLAR